MASNENSQDGFSKSETDITAGIQAEFENLIAANNASAVAVTVATDNNVAKPTIAAANTAAPSNVININSVDAPNTVLIPSQGNTIRTIAASSATTVPAGATQIVTLQPAADASRVIQNLAKRTLPSSQGGQQVVTKVIITRNPVTKQPISSTAAVLMGTASQGTPIIRTADGKQLVSTSGSPIKFVTVSSGAGLPGKNVIIASSPSKTNKLPIAQLKSPTKVVTVKTAGLTTPKKIAPAPQQVVMSVPGASPKSLLVSSTVGGTRTIQMVPAASVNRSASSTATTSQPRLIMPANLANSQLKFVTAGSGGQKFAQFPPGTTLLTTPGGNLVPVTVLPQQYQAVQQQVAQQNQNRAAAAATNQRNFVSIANQKPVPAAQAQPAPAPRSHAVNGRGPSLPTQSGAKPRKPCNCTKSMCLKLYCDCFANGEFCNNCNCNNCQNNLGHEDERAKAIKACLERNPTAFHPKIGKGRNGEMDRRHNKGCNCKRSGCLKNYCECYEAKILCSTSCKCVGCKNFEESPERKTSMHLADAAEVRVQQQTAAKDKLSSQIQEFPVRAQEVTDTGERLPFSFITNEVAEATCQCMLAQAEEVERNGGSSLLAERMILEEFGHCLLQVIHSAGRTRGSLIK